MHNVVKRVKINRQDGGQCHEFIVPCSFSHACMQQREKQVEKET